MNFQSLFLYNKEREEKRSSFKRNKQLSIVIALLACARTPYSCTHRYEAAHLNKSLLFQFHNLEPFQFWNRFQLIRFSGMNIPTL